MNLIKKNNHAKINLHEIISNLTESAFIHFSIASIYREYGQFLFPLVINVHLNRNLSKPLSHVVLYYI